jgi:type IV secretory pathway component VirB8
MKKSQPQSKNSQTIPDFAPNQIAYDTTREYFESGAKPRIERNRWFLISTILAVALLILIWGVFFQLLPLKTVETFQVNRVDSGRLVVDGTPVGSWEPDNDSIAYFLNQWGNNVFDINQSTIVQTLTLASEITIGTAVDQLSELRQKDNPLLLLKETPSLFRTYEFISVNFIKSDVALLRFKTITRAANRPPKEMTYAMTISFVRVKPKTKIQVIKNPAGLFITNFNLTEESGTK